MQTNSARSARFCADLREACGAFAVVGEVAAHASVSPDTICGRQAVKVTTGRSAILHDARVARQDHRAHYFLVRQLAGESRMAQGLVSQLKPGDFFLATSRSQSEFVYMKDSAQLSIHLPHEELSELFGRALARGRYVAGDSVVGRALARACARNDADLAVEDLLALMLHGGEVPDLELADAAIALTGRRARDPDLSPKALAELLGANLRSLQRALGAQGMTAGGLILETRLSHAENLLRNNPQQTILACASEAGFSDISGFNRVFRRERGLTPGQFRREICRDSPRRP